MAVILRAVKTSTGVVWIIGLFTLLQQPAIASDDGLRSLKEQIAVLQKTVQSLQTQNALLAGKVIALEASTKDLKNEIVTHLRPLEPYVSVDTSTLNGLSGPHIIFTGANIHIRNGKGPFQNSTVASGCSGNGLCDGSALTSYVNGVGNLVVGYDEIEPPPYRTQRRTGSHNIVIGFGHEFTGNGGFVTGLLNVVSGASTTVSGGFQNEASGIFTSVSGGAGNTAAVQMTSVSGGVSNRATGFRASVCGGQSNLASGQSSTVSGGLDQTASGFAASISGGASNIAAGNSSSISGGSGIVITGDVSWAAGSLHSP